MTRHLRRPFTFDPVCGATRDEPTGAPIGPDELVDQVAECDCPDCLQWWPTVHRRTMLVRAHPWLARKRR